MTVTTILTSRKAIRARCLDCCCGSVKEVRLCSIPACPLYPHRSGHRPEEGSTCERPLRVIHAYCLECCCGNVNEVKLCPVTDCSLYPYRKGHRPKNVSSEEIFDENDALPEDEDEEDDA